MIDLPLAAATPTWLWATLVIGAFVAVSVLVMWLARFPTQQTPSAPGDGGAPGRSGRWDVVRVAPDQLSAEMWIDLLREAGVPAQIKPSDAVSFLGVSNSGCRVMVPAERLREAESLLAEQLDGQAVPDRNGDSDETATP